MHLRTAAAHAQPSREYQAPVLTTTLRSIHPWRIHIKTHPKQKINTAYNHRGQTAILNEDWSICSGKKQQQTPTQHHLISSNAMDLPSSPGALTNSWHSAGTFGKRFVKCFPIKLTRCFQKEKLTRFASIQRIPKSKVLLLILQLGE